MTNPPSLSPPPVCSLHTSPCVRSTRPRVCRHHAHTCFDTFARLCLYARGLFDRSHEDVWSGRTGFSACHTPHTTHHTTTQDTTYHNTPQQHDNNTSRQQTHRDRDTQRQREKRREERSEEREERRFMFSVVVHGRSLFMECFVLLNPSTPDSLAC